ncbi:hypothetical protein AAVH_39787, partial [Aphelenchoides avenae]
MRSLRGQLHGAAAATAVPHVHAMRLKVHLQLSARTQRSGRPVHSCGLVGGMMGGLGGALNGAVSGAVQGYNGAAAAAIAGQN